MAKSNSIFGFQGTIDGMTFVNSKAYGPHVRAARGTYKDAPVNEVFAHNATIMVSANASAQLLRDAIMLYTRNLKVGTVWNRLVSFCFSQISDYGSVDFSQLGNLEIDPAHTFGKLAAVQSKVSLDGNSHLDITLNYTNPPDFTRTSFVDGYRMRLVAIFLNQMAMEAMSGELSTDLIPLKETISPINFRVPIPPGSGSYVICLRIDGYLKDVMNNTATTQGMKIVNTGRLDDASPKPDQG